jgi:pilus assembly protein CpaB
MAVKVDDQKSVAGLILPGDQVDVMVFMRQNNEIPLTTTQTVLRDVRVFAVDQKVDREVDQDGKSIQARTVSLIVKPEQGETLMLAANLGTLSLSLRRPNDETKNESGGATVDKLLSSAATPALPQPQGYQPDSGESLQDWLDRVKDQQAPADEAGVEGAAGYEYSMTMFTPDGAQVFQWTNPNALPTVMAGAPAPAPAIPETIAEEESDSADPLVGSGDEESGSDGDDGNDDDQEEDAASDDAP